MRRALLVSLVVPVLVGSATSADGAPGTVNGRIAFERSGFFGGTEVWTMDQNGTDLQRVGSGSDPAWSADGTRLVLADPDGRLVVFPAEGGEPRRLEVTDGPMWGVHPAWSPDGSSIAFGGPDGVYLVPAIGGAARRLIAASQPAPAWSPDGTQLAFIGTGGAVNVMNADGSGLHALPGARAAEVSQRVSWSPDGSTIAFGDGDLHNAGIATARVDGGPAPLRLRPGVVQSTDPAWSPDGRRIAFVDGGDICVADTDGARLVRLTYGAHDDVSGHGTATNSHPAWQPRPAGSTPAGGTGAPFGPAPDWDRTLSWNWACTLVHQGRALSGTVSARRAKVGDIVTFRVLLANASTIPIGETGFAAFYSELDGGAHVVSIATSRGPCRASPIGGSNAPAIAVECKLGSLFPREAVTATVRVRPIAPGELTLVTSLPKPLPANDGTDASDRDLVQRVPVAGCTLRGTERADTLDGSRRADVLCGLDGNDRIGGGAGRDSFYAGPGDDTLIARDRYRDRVSCGSGEDTVLADRSDKVDPDCERVRRAV